MSAPVGAATFGSRPELITATYQRLRRMGFDDAEAANLTALTNGFAIDTQPWKVSELTHLLFLRMSNSAGSRWSNVDDRVEMGDMACSSAGLDAVAADTTSTFVAGTGDRSNADPSGGGVTLLSLFPSIAGPNATFDPRGSRTGTPPDDGTDPRREGR